MTKAGERQLTVTLTLTDEEAAELLEALGPRYGKSIDDFLAGMARVSAEMYLDEILGRGEYPTKSVARQQRLMKMVKYVFGNTMPEAAVVGALFHLTPSAATTLLNATAARYAKVLKKSRVAAVTKVLEGNVVVAEWKDRPDKMLFRFRCVNPAVIATMKEWLADSETAAAPLVRNSTATNIFDLHASALAVVATKVGLGVDKLLNDVDEEGKSDAIKKYQAKVTKAARADAKKKLTP